MTLSEEQRKLQVSLGLPEVLLFHPRIQYSHSTGIILLSCKVKVNGSFLGRLFQRSLMDNVYAPVAAGVSSASSLDSAVLADSGVLFVIEYQGGDFKKLLRIDLRGGEIQERGPAALEPGMFFAELASVDAAGNVVYGIAGFYPVSGIGRVPYNLVSFAWNGSQTARLATMEGAFY